MGIQENPTLSEKQFEIVGIAASAGGLVALRTLLHALPSTLKVPIVIVQHLAPNVGSILHEILQKQSALRVKQAQNGDTVSAGIVYIAPPDWHVMVHDNGVIGLIQTDTVHFLRPSADVLFASLAAQYGEHAIGIVLTGSGIDGAAGALAIRQAGGIVMVQDEQTSEFWGMPQAVVQAHAADYVLPLPEIAPMLVSLLGNGAES